MATYRTHQSDRIAISTMAIRGAGGICRVADWLFLRPSTCLEVLAQIARALLAPLGWKRRTKWAPAVAVMSRESVDSMGHRVRHRAWQPARVA